MVTLHLFNVEFGVSNFVPVERGSTGIRLICTMLVHIKIYEEVQQALYMLRYLKYVKTAKGGKRGRLLNIVLCLLQMASPFFTEFVLILSISQTFETIMIIKSFVALMFVVNVDNQFSDGFPKEIKSVSKDITLIVGKD